MKAVPEWSMRLPKLFARVTLAEEGLGIDAELGAETAPEDHITFGERHCGNGACTEERKKNTSTTAVILLPW